MPRIFIASDELACRTRTPAALKWMLNERAAVTGLLLKQDARHHGLTLKRVQAAEQLAFIEKTLETATAERAQQQEKLAALDQAIALAYAQVRADGIGPVVPWKDKYGQMGALTNFVANLLKSANAEPVALRYLMNEVVKGFGLQLLVPTERRSLLKSVRSALRSLKQLGKVEQTHGGDSAVHTSSYWRWKPKTTLADLAAKAEALGTPCASPSKPHTF